jgi:hypothetical protein
VVLLFEVFEKSLRTRECDVAFGARFRLDFEANVVHQFHKRVEIELPFLFQSFQVEFVCVLAVKNRLDGSGGIKVAKQALGGRHFVFFFPIIPSFRNFSAHQRERVCQERREKRREREPVRFGEPAFGGGVAVVVFGLFADIFPILADFLQKTKSELLLFAFLLLSGFTRKFTK